MDGAGLEFRPGSGGLDTLRITCAMSAPASFHRSSTQLAVGNDNYADAPGWRELTAVGDGMTLLSSTVPAASASNRLTSYPDSLLSAPPSITTATMEIRPGGPRLAATSAASGTMSGSSRFGAGVDGLTRAFTDLVGQRRLTLGFALLALAAAIGLGAGHALAPGHGKTLIAAYLVAERGSLRQATVMGLTVTATHTAGVLALGVLLTTATTVTPSRLYPWLGAASGLLIVAAGTVLLSRALRRRPAVHGEHDHGHQHGPAHAHSHPHGHAHSHGPAHAHDPGGRRGLVTMGVAGGLVPSPSALLVLLGGIAIGRAWFGLALVIAYGLGLAVSLVLVGFAVVRARGWLERRLHHGSHRADRTRPGRAGPGRWAVGAYRVLPAVAAGFVVLAGVGVLARSLLQLSEASQV